MSKKVLSAQEVSQAVFDKSAMHLLKQNEKSFDVNSDCVYKDLNGLSCAIGCFILDEHYESSLEGQTADCDSVKRALRLSHPGLFKDEINQKLLAALQLVHDVVDTERWYDGLKDIAMRYGLSSVEIDDFKNNGVKIDKYKAIRFKDTKEFASIYGRELYSSEIPTLLSNFWNMQSFIEHQYEYDAISILLMTRMTNECEMVDLEISTPQSCVI